MKPIHFLLLMLLLTVPACAASMGMDRGAVEPLPPGQEPVVDNAQIEAELARRPQLSEKVRVGVYFLPPSKVGGDRELAEQNWRWTPEERLRIVKTADEIDRFDLFPLSEQLVTGTDTTALRLAGARHGADAILVVGGVAEQFSESNGWVATYTLLLPILFAPGQRLKTRFRSEATLYDVRNGYLYATAEAEAERSRLRPHVWADRDGQVNETKQEVVELLSAEITRRLESLASEETSTTNEQQETED